MLSAARRAATAVVAALAVTTAGAAAAAPDPNGISVTSLTPTAAYSGASISATLSVTSTACIEVDALTVAVRSASNASFDFPGAVEDVTICPSGYTFTTGTRTFAAGTYSMFGSYRIGSTWTRLPAQTLTVTAPPTSPPGSPAAPSWNPTGSYTVAMADEFDGAGLHSRWQKGWFPTPSAPVTKPVSTSGTYKELACYDPANVTVSGGQLRLTLKHVASSCGLSYATPWTGAMVQTRDSFTMYGGSIEARVYLPPSAGSPTKPGGWPAFWLNGDDSIPWPQHGEIDVIEGSGSGTSAHTHYDLGGGVDANKGAYSATPYVGWHNVGAAWNTTAKTVTFYWDGVALATLPMTATSAQYVVFDYTTAAAPYSNPAPATSTMLVDWVRAWAP